MSRELTRLTRLLAEAQDKSLDKLRSTGVSVVSLSEDVLQSMAKHLMKAGVIAPPRGIAKSISYDVVQLGKDCFEARKKTEIVWVEATFQSCLAAANAMIPALRADSLMESYEREVY